MTGEQEKARRRGSQVRSYEVHFPRDPCVAAAVGAGNIPNSPRLSFFGKHRRRRSDNVRGISTTSANKRIRNVYTVSERRMRIFNFCGRQLVRPILPLVYSGSSRSAVVPRTLRSAQNPWFYFKRDRRGSEWCDSLRFIQMNPIFRPGPTVTC